MAITRYIAGTGYDGDRLTIYDVTNPASPVQIGTLTDALLNTAWGLCKVGDSILVNGDANNRVTQVDITNKAAMVADDDVSTVNFTEGRFAIPHPNGTHGIFIFFPDNYLGIFLPNLGTNTVTLAGAYDGDVSGGLDAPAGIALSRSGTFVYVGCFDDGLIEVINISNPASPSRVGTGFAVTGISAGSGPTAIACRGELLVVADVNADTIYTVDVTDEDGPVATPLDSLASPGVIDAPRSIVIHPTADVAYVYCSATQLIVAIDISDPSDISVLNTEALPATVVGVASSVLAISEDGRYLYAACGDDDSIQIYDLIDPTDPTLVGEAQDATDLDDCRGVIAWTEGTEDEYNEYYGEYEEPVEPTRVTQFGVEVLSLPLPRFRATQFGIEILALGPATGAPTQVLGEFILDAEDNIIATQSVGEFLLEQTDPDLMATHFVVEPAVAQNPVRMQVTHLLTELILQECPPIAALPSIGEVQFNEVMTDTWQILVFGSQPPPGIEVRYQLYAAEDPSTPLQDSGWQAWGVLPHIFTNVNPFECYAVRYGFRDQCPAQAWTFTVTRRFAEQTLVDDLIISMLQLHTQVRSPRNDKSNIAIETYNVNYPRGGAGGEGAD